MNVERHGTEDTARTPRARRPAEQIWNVLTEANCPLRVATLAELTGCSQSTVRRHVANWTLAGYVEEHIQKLPGQRRIKYVAEYEVELDHWRDTPPAITTESARKGKTVRVSDPDDQGRYTLIRHQAGESPTVTYHDARDGC